MKLFEKKSFQIPALTLPLLLGGCNLAEKIATVGQSPELSQIQNPTLQPAYQPVSMPMPESSPYEKKVNSLWESGSKAFFKDQRACHVGDILTIEIDINDMQSIEMKPQLQTQSQISSTVTGLLGLEKKVAELLPNNMDLPTILNLNSNPNLTGDSKYQVTDQIKFRIAAVIIQILPNGNMVVEGRREMRLINEVREVVLRGIIRREDISSSNVVRGDKLAEARLSYGGRGDLTDMQSAPWGHQLINKVSPF